MTELEPRAALLELLCRDGIFWSTPEHAIVSQDGSPAAWMLDSQRVSLTARGAELAARCLLDELVRFESTQLATYGVTAIPLLQACVMTAGGRYSGIVVRKEKKAIGSRKLLEGPLDRTRPVVIVDDSVSSGTSMLACVEVLEDAGFRVEGVVCLVRFGSWGSGWARLIDRGLQVASVFDVFRDLVPLVEPTRPRPLANPTVPLPSFAWDDATAPDGIHPTALARDVMERFLSGRPIPRPPAALDRTLDTSGGCWVSVRSHANVHVRHARSGFWILPDEVRPSAGEAIIRAALRTAPSVTAEQLAASALAITTFGALEECTVGEVDNERYGLLAFSRERSDNLGGALPNMPGIARDWAQFEHARTRNGRMFPFEPFVLYRHDVAKVVDPGVAWQPTGVPTPPAPAWHHADRAGRVAARARAHVLAIQHGEAVAGTLADVFADGGPYAIYLTVFRDGNVIGCVGKRVTSLDADLAELAKQALVDPRFATTQSPGPGRIAVTVSFLDDPMPFGAQEPSAIATQLVPGKHALMVNQNARSAILLPFVVLQHSLTPTQFVAEVIDKAGITRAPYTWARYGVRTWYADGDRTCHVPWGLPPGGPPSTIVEAVARLRPQLVGYLRKHRRADGTFDGLYRPLVDREIAEIERPRQIYATWTLAMVRRRDAGDDAIAPIATEGLLNEAAFALLAAAELGVDATTLVARLVGAIDHHGLVPVTVASGEGDAATVQDRVRRSTAVVLDYVLPQVVLALATAAKRGVAMDATARAAIDRAMRRCARRFRVMPSWGPVCWLPQAAAAVYALAPDADLARIAFEVVDWALPFQQVSTGGFINGEQVDSPGCTTAVYLEGLAAALGLARAVGDRARVARYEAAALAAIGFLDGLVYQERDRAMLPAPERAYGGVRLSRTAGDVRVDFVCHAINALIYLDGSGS